jgi:hypothetical protein
VGYGVTLLVLAVMLAAMAFSFIALYESAEWTHNPRNFWWLAPVIIDGPILVYTASYAIWRWRDIEKFAGHAMRVLIFFTGLSVSVNALHVAAGWEWAWERPELYGGIAMAAVAPIGALLAAHEVTRLVFMNHDEGDTFAAADASSDAAPSLVAAPEPPVEEPSPAADVVVTEPETEQLADAAEEPEPAEVPEADPEHTEAPAPIELPRTRPTTSLLVPTEVAA